MTASFHIMWFSEHPTGIASTTQNPKTGMNYARSIYAGDHVWFGQNSFIFKGSKIGSGSIIGAGSVVSNRTINSNTTYGVHL